MNYLAHLYFAGDDDRSVLGNLLPDFYRGSTRSMRERFDDAVMRGVDTHRRIDAFTDAHAVVRRSVERIDAEHRRVAAIVIDIVYDHCLSRTWTRWTDEPLAAFIARRYEALRRVQPHLQPRFATGVDRMFADDWLGAYATLDGVALSLQRVARRFEARCGRHIELIAPLADVKRDYDAVEADFSEFFPQLIEHVRHCSTSTTLLS